MDPVFYEDDMAAQFDEGYACGYEAAKADRELIDYCDREEETLS